MKRNIQRENIKGYIFLAVFTILVCQVMVLRIGVFGSKVDWISQHSVIPDYFRQLFYDTGSLFPDFAPNIGGGQNIYHFSYYGLYSPVVLISYLLPFVKMSDYMMISSIVSMMAAVLLFYHWLRKREFEEVICVGVSCMFLLAAPMVYHSYNQIMFVNYMPFLCMALIGVDRYLEEGRWGVYLIGTFLMIMTSFYFSIGGILALVLYGVYRYKKIHEKVTVGRFLTDGIQFVIPVFLSILLSGILLIPTAMALMGRQGEKMTVTIADLLIPDIKVLRFLYSPYGIGLTSLLLVVLISGILYRKCCEKILIYGLIVITAFPLVGYLLNGGLYIRDKVFIPFLPLFCYLSADYLGRMEKEIKKVHIVPYLIMFVILLFLRDETDYEKYWVWSIAEAGILFVLFLIYIRKRNIYLFIVPIVCGMCIYGVVMQESAGYILEENFYEQVTDGAWESVIDAIAEEDAGNYRVEQHGSVTENAANLNRIHSMDESVTSIYSSTYNEEYQRFRTETYQLEQPFRNMLMQSVSENPLFLRFMGVKYIISDTKPFGYELYMESDGRKVWINEDVAPLCYVTDQIMGESQYESLEFPYKQTALNEYAVVQADAAEVELGTKVKEVAPEFPENLSAGMKIALPEEVQAGQVLFLQFDVTNKKPSRDVEITIEGIRNKLSASSHVYYNRNTRFTYVTGIEEGQRYLEIERTKGEFEIHQVRAYVAENDDKKGEVLYQNPVNIVKEETKGNHIVGNVEVEEDGYFVSSIPYDENFTVCVDGKEVDYEKVNTAFLGFKMEKGSYRVEITYHAPGAAAGRWVSLAGLLGVMVLAFCKRSIHLQQ